MEDIYIRKVYSVDFIELAVRDEIKDIPITINGVEFFLSFVEREPDKKYYRQCPLNIVATSLHRENPRKIPPILEKISQGFRSPEGKKAATLEELVIRDGPDYNIDFYPDYLKNFLEPIQKIHNDFIKMIITKLSWRCVNLRRTKPRNILGRLTFSADGLEWHNLPPLERISGKILPSPPIVNDYFNSVESIADFATTQDLNTLPIELLVEAKNVLAVNSARSALVIAVSALEVKLKDFVSKKSHSSEWLVNNLQSPPVDKLLAEYIPLLVDDESEYSLRISPYLSEIKKIIKERNEIAHSGQEVTNQKVTRYIGCIEEIMYLLDTECNLEWANEGLISSEE